MRIKFYFTPSKYILIIINSLSTQWFLGPWVGTNMYHNIMLHTLQTEFFITRAENSITNSVFKLIVIAYKINKKEIIKKI